MQNIEDLIKEKEGLKTKMDEITSFIESSDFNSDTITHFERHQYTEQQRHMYEYHAILHDRLAALQSSSQ